MVDTSLPFQSPNSRHRNDIAQNLTPDIMRNIPGQGTTDGK